MHFPGLGRSPGEGNGSPLQSSCLENTVDRGAWRATVHGVTESDTTESDLAQPSYIWISDKLWILFFSECSRCCMGHTYTEKLFSLFIRNWNLTGSCVFYLETQIWKSRTQTFKLWDRREADQVGPTRGSWCFTKLPTSQRGSATLCATVESSCCGTATRHIVV